MADAWVRWLHWGAGALWCAALLVIAVRRVRGAGDGAFDQRLYGRVAVPAAFVTLLTLVALLHASPRLLLGRVTQVELVALFGLAAADWLCGRPAGRRRGVVVAILVLSTVTAAVTDVLAFSERAGA